MVNIGDSHVAAFFVDKYGHIVSWSSQCEQLFGYAAEEVMQRPYMSLVTPARTRRGGGREQSGWTTSAVPVELICRSGSILRAYMSLLPQAGPAEDLTGYIVLIASSARMRDNTALRKFIDSLPGPFYVIDSRGHFVMWNRKLEQAVGKDASQLAGMYALNLFDEKDKPLIEQKISETLQKGHTVAEAHLITANQERVPYLFNCSRILMNRKACICGMGIDMSKRKKYEEMLRLRERAIEASVNGVIITRCSGRDNIIEYVNPAFEHITGYREQEVLGTDPRFMRAPDLDLEETQRIRVALEARRSVHVVLRNRRKNGEMFWNDLKIDPVSNTDGEVTHFVGVITDVTEAKQSESKLAWLASHDPLTGLANRTLMREHLELAILHAHRHQCLVALVFIDLDRFKPINDILGHDVGDQVLKTIASRLRANVRESDIVARIGGDEFVLVLANQPSIESVSDLVDRLHSSAAEPMSFLSTDMSPTISAGISLYPHDGMDVTTLMQHADTAMYHAKSVGRNNYQFYSSQLQAAAQLRMQRELHLREAIEQDQLFLLFQPRVDIRSGRIVGAEALVRWRHPEHGVLMPETFIPLAEETGLVTELGEWVLERTCKALQQFRVSGLNSFSISINLSLRQLRQKDFVELVVRHLRAASLPPQCLELELTENQLMDDPGKTIAILAQLKSLGVKLAIDDFGTGYSSLAYLRKVPVDHIKIDKSFVQDIGRHREEDVITKAVIALGHNLNITVVAEGVETEAQYAFLREHQCDELQGYYFSEPLIAGPLQSLLHRPAQSLPR